MSDLIDRQAAIEALEVKYMSFGIFREQRAASQCIDVIKNLPSAQLTGRWIVVSDGYGNGEATACICECSECKDTIWVYKKSDRKWKYCPNCGVRMEVEE